MAVVLCVRIPTVSRSRMVKVRFNSRGVERAEGPSPDFREVQILSRSSFTNTIICRNGSPRISRASVASSPAGKGTRYAALPSGVHEQLLILPDGGISKRGRGQPTRKDRRKEERQSKRGGGAQGMRRIDRRIRYFR
jgi:hypothetical protein